jgi:hypothetical protein
MTAGKGNLVVARGGGPTAAVNASLYGVVREAAASLDVSAGIWGARGGILGVLNQRWTVVPANSDPIDGLGVVPSLSILARPRIASALRVPLGVVPQPSGPSA